MRQAKIVAIIAISIVAAVVATALRAPVTTTLLIVSLPYALVGIYALVNGKSDSDLYARHAELTALAADGWLKSLALLKKVATDDVSGAEVVRRYEDSVTRMAMGLLHLDHDVLGVMLREHPRTPLTLSAAGISERMLPAIDLANFQVYVAGIVRLTRIIETLVSEDESLTAWELAQLMTQYSHVRSSEVDRRGLTLLPIQLDDELAWARHKLDDIRAQVPVI